MIREATDSATTEMEAAAKGYHPRHQAVCY